jgi:release factor glutamine methyltransferase
MNFSQLKQNFNNELSHSFSSKERTSLFKTLIEHIFQKNILQFIAEPYQLLHPTLVDICKNAIIRLKNDEPIEHIISKAQFSNLNLWVNHEVLIPRPETEEIVEYVYKKYCQNNDINTQGTIIDFCTGSGCIALALKQKLNHFHVYGTDVSRTALEIARSNSHFLNLNVDFFHHDLLNDSDLPFPINNVKIIVSNPPYILHSEKPQMHNRVINYEPEMALFACKEDAIIFYKVLKDYSLRYLSPEGMFAFEINHLLSDAIQHLFTDTNDSFHSVQIVKDIYNKNRFIVGQKKSI